MSTSNDIARAMTLAECCKFCGRPPVYIRNIQKALKLPAPNKADGYPVAYVVFLKSVVALRVLNVSMETIGALLEKEKALLRLLKLDAFGDSDIWYLAQCGARGNRDRRLLLTGYDVGFALSRGAIQAHLDFGSRDQELFDGKEMGEDVRRAVDVYVKAVGEIKARARRECAVLKHALQWARESCND